MALLSRFWLATLVGIGLGVGFGSTLFFSSQRLEQRVTTKVLDSLEQAKQTNTEQLLELASTNSDLSVSNLPTNLTLSVTNQDQPEASSGVVLSIDEQGKIILVPDQISNINTVVESDQTTSSIEGLPTAETGATLYKSSQGWLASTKLFNSGDKLGLATLEPKAKFHINTEAKENIGLIVQGYKDQNTDLTQWWTEDDRVMLAVNNHGKLTFYNQANDHAIEIIQTGNAGHLSSDAGAIRIDNTGNLGAGLSIYSNADSDALGNMINVKVDNPAYAQAAFYMNYDGISNAVEIVSNTNDSTSNALSITNYNTQDSALGVIGYETGRGTIKVSHFGTGSDANASGISVDLKGTGTKAQGLYVDSTATGGTTGNLLRLRNESVDRFVVNYLGATSIGSNGTDTSITKHGNIAGDEFFVGITGAFRVQRSASDSEAFRVQINGDTQGRWLGTSDGKLKWGDGSSSHDVVLRRSGAGTLLLDGAILDIKSAGSGSDVNVWTAADGSRLGRVVETGGGHGWFEIDNNTGAAAIVFRADGGNSYVNSGNFGVGTTSFGTSANKVISIGNGVAPTSSITDGVQLYAIDYVDGDGTSTSELFVRDEDGNATNLSPHNFSLIPDGPSEPLAWSFYSTRDGLAINVDMTRAIRLVEDLSGEQLVYLQDLETGQVQDSSTTPTESALASLQNQVKFNQEQLASIDARLQAVEVLPWLVPDQLWQIVSTVIFEAQVKFAASVEFLAEVAFQQPVVARQDLSVEGELKLDGRQVGRVVMPAGQNSVTVLFEEPLSESPVVTTSVNQFLNGSYKVTNKTNLGFMIELEEAQAIDLEFDWIAIATQVAPAQIESNEVEVGVVLNEGEVEVASGSSEQDGI